MTYAADTVVPVARTREEIERIVTKYGATRFATATEEGRAAIIFDAENRRVRFEMQLPQPADFAQARGRYGYSRPRSAEARTKLWEQACRSKWRALLLVIKAKLEAVESGIETFEEAFLPHIVLPNGGTVGQWMEPQLEAAYGTGKMPPLLGDGRG